jgi:hypothetical protein
MKDAETLSDPITNILLFHQKSGSVQMNLYYVTFVTYPYRHTPAEFPISENGVNQSALEHPVGSDRLHGIRRYHIEPDGIIIGRYATKLLDGFGCSEIARRGVRNREDNINNLEQSKHVVVKILAVG